MPGIQLSANVRSLSECWDTTFCQCLITLRMLGYNFAVPRVESHFGEAKAGEEFGLTNLECSGDEARLLDCPYSRYCTVLYCIVLYCTVLYCTVLYCTVLHCTVLYCTALYCTVLYCTVLYSLQEAELSPRRGSWSDLH